MLRLDATADQRAVALRERARASIGAQPRDAEYDLRMAAAAGDAEAAYLLAEVFTLDSANEHHLYGQQLFALDRHHDAIAAVSTALSTGLPDDERRQAWELLGRAHLAADEFAEAIEVLSRLVDEAPTARTYQLRGRASYEAGLDGQARADLDRAIALDPSDASAYRCRGEVALAVRAYEEAVADLTRAVALAPGDPDAWYYRAYAHSSLGETEAKRGDLLMAERAGHRNAATVRRGEYGDETAGDAHDLGLRAWRAGDFALAVSTLDRAFRMYLGGSRASNDTAERRAMQVRANLGSAKLAAGDVDGGLADLRAVVAGRPLFYNGWLALGRGQLQHASPATALPTLDRAIGLLPLRPDAYVLRGRARQELGRHAEAAEDLTRAIELEPVARELRFEARRRRATSRRALGQWGDAADDLEVALELATYDEADEVRAELVDVRASDPVAYARDRTGAFAEAARGRVALLREWELPDDARARELGSDPVPMRLPAAGATVVFTPHDGYDTVTVETGSVRRLDLPPLPAGSRIASVSPDGTHLLVGSGTLIREVRLPDGELIPVLQGTWYTQAAHLANGLAVVLASGAAVTLRLSDPDVRALLEVRGYVPPAGETSVGIASNDALYLIDVSADRDNVLVASIAVVADRMKAVRGGRFLVLRRTAAGDTGSWMTAVVGVVDRRLVLLAWFEVDLGEVVELDGRVYGSNGYELIGLDAALANAPEQVLTSIAQVLSQPAQQPSAGSDLQTGALRFVPVAEPPRPPRMEGVKELVGPYGDVGEARHGRYALAFAYHGDETYRVGLAVCDESGRQTWLRPIEPPLVGRLPRCAFVQDATACLVAIGTVVHEVDCATGTARVVLEGDEPVVDVAAVDGGFAVIRRRQEYEGYIEIYRGGESTVSGRVSCGPMDSLTVLADGRVLIAAFTNQLNDLGRLQSYVFAVRDADARLIGPVDLVVERGWDVGGRCIVGTTARAHYEVVNVDVALDQAFAGPVPEPPDLLELSGWTHPTTFSTYMRSSR